jgi:hypothetical protein
MRKHLKKCIVLCIISASIMAVMAKIVFPCHKSEQLTESEQFAMKALLGIVYDYRDSLEDTWNIPPEHPINSPAGIYESFGEERRPTP